jgi:CheY-like chemotaxis protein
MNAKGGAHKTREDLIAEIEGLNRALAAGARAAPDDVHDDARLTNELLDALGKTQSRFISETETNLLFDELLAKLHKVTGSEYGLIGQVLCKPDGAPYLKCFATTDISWNSETRLFYEKHAPEGLEFYNLKSLFGAVLSTGRTHETDDEGVNEDGSVFSVHIKAFPVFGPDGTATGFVEVESTPGAGTTFHLYLPASKAGFPIKKDQTAAPLNPGSGRILVMDDEEVVREVVKEYLKKLGYEPTVTRDGREALSAYERAAREGNPFKAVIMDLTIPGGMGGKDAIGEFKRLDKDVRVMVSSGYSDDPIMSDFVKFGFKGVVTKPYTIQKLAETLSLVAG